MLSLFWFKRFAAATTKVEEGFSLTLIAFNYVFFRTCFCFFPYFLSFVYHRLCSVLYIIVERTKEENKTTNRKE